MYIVNTSFMVEPEVHDKWFEFIAGKFIPRLQHDECIDDIVFTRVLSDQRDAHFTYSLQVHVQDISAYQYYVESLFDEYLQIAVPLFSVKVSYFTTLLKKIQCYETTE